MEIIGKIKEMQDFSEKAKREGKSIGFVPTMGFLHEGHLSIIRKAREENDLVIVSIFVNPKQFSPDEDYDEYPRDFEKDKKVCEAENVDAIFNPAPGEMYKESRTKVVVEGLTEGLCGKSRPGFFEGVTTVVAKLFNIVKPDKAYFGRKDFQQLIVVRKMVLDLNFDLEIVACNIVREENGLAMSSRNKYLNEEEREKASILFKALQEGRKMFKEGEKDSEKVIKEIREMIEKEGIEIDYLSIVDSKNLKSRKEIEKGNVIAVAAFIGKARLIDNIEF